MAFYLQSPDKVNAIDYPCRSWPRQIDHRRQPHQPVHPVRRGPLLKLAKTCSRVTARFAIIEMEGHGARAAIAALDGVSSTAQ